MTVSEALVIFARQPDSQTSKTRLSPPLSRAAAARLYACFLADTLAAARRMPQVGRIIAYDPAAAEGYFAALAPDFQRMPQAGANLGDRMHQALATLFAQGLQRVVLIGSDLPHLPPQTLRRGFEALRRGAEVTLGPSLDGGYYLIGLTRPQPQLFDLPMSTPDVLRQTLERVERLGLRLTLLPEMFDIDTGVDLARLRAMLEAQPAIPARCTRAWLANSNGE